MLHIQSPRKSADRFLDQASGKRPSANRVPGRRRSGCEATYGLCEYLFIFPVCCNCAGLCGGNASIRSVSGGRRDACAKVGVEVISGVNSWSLNSKLKIPLESSVVNRADFCVAFFGDGTISPALELRHSKMTTLDVQQQNYYILF